MFCSVSFLLLIDDILLFNVSFLLLFNDILLFKVLNEFIVDGEILTGIEFLDIFSIV